MPVFDLTAGWINPGTRPEWLGLVAVGRFCVPVEGARFDRHFHDDNEIWIITAGKAKIVTDKAEHYVQAGDVVMTKAGDVHDFVEVYEAVAGFFVETGHPAGGRAGHLYERDEDRDGHPVPARRQPADFPTR